MVSLSIRVSGFLWKANKVKAGIQDRLFNRKVSAWSKSGHCVIEICIGPLRAGLGAKKGVIYDVSPSRSFFFCV